MDAQDLQKAIDGLNTMKTALDMWRNGDFSGRADVWKVTDAGVQGYDDAMAILKQEEEKIKS